MFTSVRTGGYIWLQMATRGDRHLGLSKSSGPPRRRPAKNVTLSQKILGLLAAYADHEEESGRPRPSRAWMLEQGAALFLEREKSRSETLRSRLAEVEE